MIDEERLGRVRENVNGQAKAEPDPFAAEIATALADVQRALGSQSTTNRAPLFGTDATQLLAEDFPPTAWQIDGLIARGGTAVAAGEPKAAIKTWLAIEGAVAIATGTRMAGEFFAKRGRAVIFFAEDERQSVRNRVRALLAGAGRTLQPGQLYLESRGAFLDVLKDEDLAWIVASCRRLGPIDLLVLDPLRDVHSGEEDKSDSMRDVMRRLRVLGQLLSCTVLVTHHVPKANKDTAKRRVGQNLRGSSAIHGSIDSGLYIEPGEGDGTNVFRAAVTSQVKSGRSAGTFDLELRIIDDAEGSATSATWSFSRADFKRGPTKNADDEAVFTFVRDLAIRGEVLTRTGLRLHDSRPIADRRMIPTIDRLIECKRLALSQNGRVVLPEQECSAND